MGTFNDGDSGSSIRTKLNTAIQKTEGTSAISTIDVDGGAIDGVTIGTNSAVTDLRVDNLQLDGNTVSSTNLNGDITIDPNGTGDVNIGNFKFDADQTVGAGQDNYVLTYDNAGGKISLEAAAGGGGGGNFTLVSTTTISSSVSSVDISLSGSYTTYCLVGESITWSTGTRVNLRVSTDSGSTFKSGSTDYNWAGRYRYAGNGGAGAANLGALNQDDVIELAGAYGTATDSIGFSASLYAHDSSSLRFALNAVSASSGTNNVAERTVAGSYNAITAVTDIRLLPESGTFNSGVIKLYGLN